MSRDRFDVLERFAPLFEAPEPSVEGFIRRRDRKRRNQRIAAGAVGIAVFVAAVWVVMSGGLADRAADGGQLPASSGVTTPPAATTAPAVEPTRAPSAGGSQTTAPWFEASALPQVDYVIDLTNGATTPLPDAILGSSLGRTDETGALTHYAVSPDGTKLAFVGTGGEEATPQIFIGGVDGTSIRQVTNSPGGADWPAWSPDGTKIAYGGVAGDGLCCHDLFILDVATGGSTRIVDGEAWEEGLQFTPDGSSVVYTGGQPPDNAEMRIVPVAGGQSAVLFGGGHRGIGHAGAGALSRDGSLATFVGHEVGGPGALRFVVNVDGTELRYTRGRHSNPAGVWSPDGGRIVALSPDTRHGDIIVIDVVTGDALLVAEGSEAIWLDDHRLLVEV